jgi:hypothetical protein
MRKREWFANQPSLADAMGRSCVAQNSKGNRYSYQRRLTKAGLQQALRALQEATGTIRRARDFELFNLIRDEVESIPV